VNPLRWADDFLIDRVYQPVADRLAGWISCYGIAAFLLTGFAISRIVYLVHNGSEWWYWLLSLWIFLAVADAHSQDRATPTNVVPNERIRTLSCFNRLMLTLIAFMAVTGFLNYDVWQWVENVGWFGAWVAFYFLACRRMPPKPKRVKAPMFAAEAR
jgi:hypothetical protein